MLKSSVPESSNIFICNCCDYITSRYSQFQRHNLTAKHQNNEKSTVCQHLSTNVNKKSSEFVCSCGKIYKERTGLWKHKKKCIFDYEYTKETWKTWDIFRKLWQEEADNSPTMYQWLKENIHNEK